MPNRIIKESIRGSEDLAAVSPEAERLFWRLVVSVDDFGRFDARPKTVIGQCLTAFLGSITSEQVNQWLLELEHVGILQLYTVEDRPYLVLTKWSKHQRVRAKDSKFPSPDDSCGHPLTNDSKRSQSQTFASSTENENENVNENDSGNEGTLPPLNDESGLSVDDYCQEVELQMVACGASSSYKAQDKAYQWILKFYNAGVPISFVRRCIVQAYAKKEDISTFAYIAKIVKDEWARELAKSGPIDPLEITTSVASSGPDIDEDFLKTYRMTD